MYTEYTTGTNYKVSWQELISSYKEWKWELPEALTHSNKTVRKIVSAPDLIILCLQMI